MPSNHSNGNSSLEIAHSNQDLIITKGKRKKRACIVGTVVGLVVVALVVALVVVLTTRSSNENSNSEEDAIELEDILDGRLSVRGFNASWISDKTLMYRNSDGSLIMYDVTDQTQQEILPNTTSALKTSFDYELSPDGQYILMAHDYQKLYRHTYLARYTIIDLNTHQETLLHEGVSLHYAAWGPIGNSIVYVWANNIYYKSSALVATSIAITNDGLDGHIYNGVPDWVYEEEVFGSNHAMWFSPNGKKLAYVKFNDNTTALMTIPYYGIPGSLDSQYTKAVQIRYPKPGTKNPDVSLHVYDIDTAQTLDLPVPSDLSEEIISAVSWATDTVVSPIWLNRVQNEAYIVAYDTSSYARANEYTIIQHIRQVNGWLNFFTAPIFSKDGSQLLLIQSQDQGEGSGSYKHITRLNAEANAEQVAVTSGKFVVTEILGWNEERNLIYYLATTEADPAVQHVYSVSTNNNNNVNCMSCNIETNLMNEKCLYNSARFSKDLSYYVFNCAGPGIPELSLFSAETLSKLSVWEDNQALVSALRGRSLPKVQRLVVDVADDFKALVSLKLPPNIDLSGSTKYPMVVNVYGGPDSYQVIEKFTIDWGTYLATNKSIIYATIDGRGSGLKGDKILFSGYRHLGTVEIEDQINVTKQIQQTVPYVDETRTAIWGWSYGGYASGLVLATDKENVFKCGMSVAPVTDWTLYDSIYTERFMGLPTDGDNAEGYDKAKLLDKYDGLRNKEYFLIHGTFDDNVHYQQSMLWSKVLEHQDVMFRQQSYPDEDHGLGAVRPHLYHSLENFLDECFIENV